MEDRRMSAIITFIDGEIRTIQSVQSFKSTGAYLALHTNKGSYIYPLKIVSLFILSL